MSHDGPIDYYAESSQKVTSDVYDLLVSSMFQSDSMHCCTLQHLGSAYHDNPPMIRCMIPGIQQWLTDGNEPYDFSAHSPEAHLHLVHLAYIDQSSIGWVNLLRGRIATAWLQAQDQYYSLRHLHDKYSTTHFAPALVRHLWDFSLAIW